MRLASSTFLDFVDDGEEGDVDDGNLVLVAAALATAGRVEAERLELPEPEVFNELVFRLLKSVQGSADRRAPG